MADVFDAPVTPGVDDNKDYHSELVGEGKKYKTDADLAKGAFHAQNHIQNLERSLQELREDLKTRTTQDDLLTEIRRLRTEPVKEVITETQPPQNQTSGLTKDEVNNMLAERERTSQQNVNLTTAVAKLQQMYGDNTAVEIDKKAKELGMSRDDLRDMAKTRPQVFTALFQPPAPKDVFNAPPNSNRNPAANVGPVAGKYSDYQRVRREDPKRYHSREFQAEILRTADRIRARSEAEYQAWMNS